jgi:cytochrome c biogenesis protein
MRFAISLLTLICIASVIGTVVKQNEPYNNYVNQFGPFWAEVFGACRAVHGLQRGWWFLLILAFLVTSTSLCIARNTPKILARPAQLQGGRARAGAASFHHKAEATLALSRRRHAGAREPAAGQPGWKARAQVRGHGTMVAARKGMANKIGYLAAHSAIVLICLGGLFDGDLVVRAQMALQGKTPFEGGGLISDVPAEHRLANATPPSAATSWCPRAAAPAWPS